MLRAPLFFLPVLLLLVSGRPSALAQDAPGRAIYVIMDGSGSMWGALPDASRKVEVAKAVLQNFVAQDFGSADLALRVYGHRERRNCRDSELVVPLGDAATAVPQVEAFARELNPLGMTPIAYSLREALNDMDGRAGEIILITDGNETCDEDPCTLVRAWREQDIAVNVHVVGFGIEAQERGALQCIAEAAGTAYRDASSADELAAELAQIREDVVEESPTEAEPGPPPSGGSVALTLRGVDAQGNAMPIEGHLVQDGVERFAVTSDGRNVVEAGPYDLVVGVRTQNGTLYRPVTRPLTTSATDDMVVEVEVVVPPSASAVFIENGEERRGALIRAYQDGAEVFTFRPFDTVYVDEGTYTFQSTLNQDNTLEVTASFAAGEHKTLRFEAVATVRARFSMHAGSSDVRLRGNYDLYQDGEKRYDVHTSNGADIRPGTYDIHLDNDLIPHVERGVVVPASPEEQHIEFDVPVGFVTFVYESADGTREGDRRVFIGRGERGRSRTKQSGERIALVPGTYRAEGWPGTYDTLVFEVVAGSEQTIALRTP
ncbi:MAG: VWA domain-containing protein [Bacteroidota bacterium]